MITTFFQIFELPQWNLRLPFLNSEVDPDTNTITQIVGAWLVFILAFVFVMLFFDDSRPVETSPQTRLGNASLINCFSPTTIRPENRQIGSQKPFTRISELTESCHVHVF